MAVLYVYILCVCHVTKTWSVYCWQALFQVLLAVLKHNGSRVMSSQDETEAMQVLTVFMASIGQGHDKQEKAIQEPNKPVNRVCAVCVCVCIWHIHFA